MGLIQLSIIVILMIQQAIISNLCNLHLTALTNQEYILIYNRPFSIEKEKLYTSQVTITSLTYNIHLTHAREN